MTGKPFSSHSSKEDYYKTDFDVHYFVLNMDRQKLYDRINKRVDIMLENGLVDECKKLKDMGLTADIQSMQGIGYKEILYYLDNKCSFEESVEMIKQGSRNYAKRQLTWFKRDKRVKFLDKDTLSDDDIENLIINEMESR